MPNSWRLIVSGAASGATNMAIDEALLRTVSVPVLRFYRWSPACLSIGALQQADKAVVDEIGVPGTDWVRRISGGRALLHDDELTYSVTAPVDHPLMQGSVRDSHARIANLLAQGLRSLGIPAAIEPAGRKARATSACYDVASDFELTVHGRKLVGSAQVRRTCGILQHGSIPFRLDPVATVTRLRLTDEERADLVAVLRERVIALEDILSNLPNDERIIEAMAAVWNENGMPVRPDSLTEDECRLAATLEGKYRSPEWNQRRQLPARGD